MIVRGLPPSLAIRNMSGVTIQPEPAQGHAGSADPGGSGRGAEAEGSSGVDEQDSPMLTVAAVARRLGVAPATLRTWDRRYGLGPGNHTSGRHRRYGPDDIARLERMQRALLKGASPAEAARYARSADVSTRSPAAEERAPEPSGEPGAEPVLSSGVLEEDDPAPVEVDTGPNHGGRGLKLTGSGSRARGLGRAVLALDSWSAQRLLAEAIDAEGVVATWRDVLCPVLRALVERRQSSGSGIEAQQLVIDCASTAFRSVIAGAPAPENPRPVLIAAVPGEAQDLPLVALAAALSARRVGHRLFAGTLPQEGLESAVRRAAPAALVLWAERPHYASARLLGQLPNTRQHTRVFAGGPGWQDAGLPPHAERVESVEQAVERLAGTLLG